MTRLTRLLDALLRDLRFALRLLAARPGWTLAAILCLAIATGANTAAFTIVNGLLLRPLPFDEPHQLVMVALRDPRQAATRPFALREYRALADRARATTTLLARTFFPLSLASGDEARMAQAELVSGNYFETLRVTPFLGRFFDASADREGGAPVAVLSHRLWQVRFGSDAAIVGRTVRVNGRAVTIAGVAPPDFVGAMQLVAADLWLPAIMYPDLASTANASTSHASTPAAGAPDASTTDASTGANAVPMFGVMGRLAATVTVDEASARLTAAMATVAMGGDATDPQAPPAVIVTPATGFGVPVAVEGAVLTFSGLLYVLMAMLMAVACANVAALVLARGVGRDREIAVRLSLGASRLHIARQLVTESVVLAIAGCVAGTVVAIWLTQTLVSRLTTPFQYARYAIDVHPDARVFVYSAIATIAAAVLCGIAPIRLAGRVDVVEVLKQSAARGRSRESMRTLNAMVVLQFAVSTTLLVAAAMLVRTYLDAQTTRPAVETSRLIASTLDVDQVQLDRSAGIRLYERITERLSALPGVLDVSLSRDAPFASGRTETVATERERATASAMAVSSRYFRTLGLSILQGRSFTDNEPARPRVAVIDDAMARRLWPHGSPVGHTFRLDRIDPAIQAENADVIEVIGVVSNSERGSRSQAPQPAFYQPFTQAYAARMTIVLRVHGDPSPFIAEVRRAVRDVNQDLSIVDLRTIDDLLADRAAQRRLPATAFVIVGLLGLLLSAVGLYGVVAYGVRERARELGIRLALGARPADVRRLVLRQGFTMVGLGLAIGGAATIALARVLRSTVFGVDAIDPLTLASVSLVLVAAGCAALYLPARSASAVEPAHTLRGE